jgi:RNA polymerase primary sigma factor
MKAYIHDIGDIPLITKEEEVVLAALIKRGDEPARQKLIKSNLRLVVKIAHDFKGFGLPLLDLISEGNIGLMRAAEKFDPAKGAKFSSYSAWWIKQSMRRALSQKSRTIRVPVASAGKISKIRMAKMQLSERLGRSPTDTEIAQFLNLTKRTVQGLKLADLRTFSLHDPIQKGEEGSFEEIIPDTCASTPDEIIEGSESIQRLRNLIYKLDDRERTILLMRYGLDGNKPKTLEEVSRKIGRTRERVRQIQMQSLKKLKAMIEDETIDNDGNRVELLQPFGPDEDDDDELIFEDDRLDRSPRRRFMKPAAGERMRHGLTRGKASKKEQPWLNPETLGFRKKQLFRSKMPISALTVSSRSKNRLASIGIINVAQLASKTHGELITIRYFGKKCLQEVQQALEELARVHAEMSRLQTPPTLRRH